MPRSSTEVLGAIRRPALRRWWAPTLVLVSGCAALALAQGSLKKLVLNGKVASTRVKVIDGMAYVPVADIAQALGQPVHTTAEGYEISLAGGANQVAGLQGKLGDVLFDGVWRFQVTKVTEASVYQERYTANRPLEQKPGDNQKLILVDITVKNGANEKKFLLMRDIPENLTALAGEDGSSAKVFTYDMRTGSGQHFGGGGDWDSTPEMLPGSQAQFTAVFRTPQDFKPKDLVFTLNYEPKQFARMKHVTLRVALTPPATP
jgi:hypothetical protein